MPSYSNRSPLQYSEQDRLEREEKGAVGATAAARLATAGTATAGTAAGRSAERDCERPWSVSNGRGETLTGSLFST